MAKPLTLDEQTHRNYFKYKHKKAILFSQGKYDACLTLKKGKGRLGQAMPDLDTVHTDSDQLKACLEKF